MRWKIIGKKCNTKFRIKIQTRKIKNLKRKSSVYRKRQKETQRN